MTEELNLKEMKHLEVAYPKQLVEAINNSETAIAKEIGKGTHLRTSLLQDEGLDLVIVVKKLAPHESAQLHDNRHSQATFINSTAGNWVQTCLVWPEPSSEEISMLMTEISSFRQFVVMSANDVGMCVSESLKKRLSKLYGVKTPGK